MSKNSYETIVSPETFNQILDDLQYQDIEVIKIGTTLYFDYRGRRFETSLTDNKRDTVNIGNIMAQFSKFAKGYNYRLPEGSFGKKTIDLGDYKTRVTWDIEDPGNYMYSDDDHKRQWLKCYSYDMNSAYSYAMTKPIPDTSKEPRLNDIVKENEIGFYTNGHATTEIGAFAEYIFPLIESPFKAYIYNYYDKKQKAKTEEERNNWKYFLNIPTGMMHKYNIFIRNTILYWCAEHIKKYKDKNTVYCNTDSIVSLVRRTDIPIGDGLGEFKEEHVNDNFKYIAPCRYQWNQECHYSGVVKGTITDIENVEHWQDNLPYKYNKETRRIEKCQEQEQKEVVDINMAE